MKSVNSPRYYKLFIESKNVKVKKNRKGALPPVYKLHIQWRLFHNIIKVIVVKYNTAEIKENFIFYDNAMYLFEDIHLCIKRQAESNYHLTMHYCPGIHLKVL